MTILIKNGRVINPATGTDETLDVLVENGVVARTEKSIKEKCDRVIDAKGCFVMPGFIDMHVHLRDPGFEQKEHDRDRRKGSSARRIYDDSCHAEHQAGRG